MSRLKRIDQNRALYGVIAISMLYFLFKGISYLLINSFVPFLFIATILALFSWSFYASSKAHKRIIKLWAILIIIWSLVRLILLIGLEIDQNLTEAHLREQFGFLQNLLSLFMLTAGIMIFVFVKRLDG